MWISDIGPPTTLISSHLQLVGGSCMFPCGHSFGVEFSFDLAFWPAMSTTCWSLASHSLLSVSCWECRCIIASRNGDKGNGSQFFFPNCVCVCVRHHTSRDYLKTKKEALTIGLKQTKKPKKSLFFAFFLTPPSRIRQCVFVCVCVCVHQCVPVCESERVLASGWECVNVGQWWRNGDRGCRGQPASLASGDIYTAQSQLSTLLLLSTSSSSSSLREKKKKRIFLATARTPRSKDPTTSTSTNWITTTHNRRL